MIAQRWVPPSRDSLEAAEEGEGNDTGVPVLAGSCIFLSMGTWNEVRNLNLIVKSGRKEMVLANILQGLSLVGMLF